MRNINGKYYGVFGRGIAFQAEMSWVRIPMALLEIFIDKFFPAALWPWGRHSLWNK